MRVNGIEYDNTASHFWPRITGEAYGLYPELDAIELSAPATEPLDRSMLRPGLSLQKDIDRLWSQDFSALISQTMAELEIFGPPASVQCRLMHENRPPFESALPIDCVDSEIFPYLLVWLLEWAQIPESLWNMSCVEGAFRADYPDGISQHMSFELKKDHLSEDLHRHILIIRAEF